MKTSPFNLVAWTLLASCSGLSTELGLPHFGGLAQGQVIALPGRVRVLGISDDGQTVSGVNSGTVGNNGDYFLWRDQGGFFQANANGIGQGFVSPISGDGHFFGGADPLAFVIRDTGVRTNIGSGSPGLNASIVEGLSQNGSAAAGWSYGQSGALLAGWRWTAAGGIQLLPGWVTARGISGDGNTVVGTAGTGSTAVVWHNGVTTVLPIPAGTTGPFGTSAWQTNFDGSRIVGSSGNNAAVWVNGQGSLLPLLSGYGAARATDLSDDGMVIIGNANPGAITAPEFIWTPSRGTELLSSYFASFGVSLPEGNTILSAVVTPDGRTFGITASDPDGFARGFIVAIPGPGTPALAVLGLLAIRRRRRLA